jgi:hypothetical protein
MYLEMIYYEGENPALSENDIMQIREKLKADSEKHKKSIYAASHTCPYCQTYANHSYIVDSDGNLTYAGY